jgi:hypothetical protein
MLIFVVGCVVPNKPAQATRAAIVNPPARTVTITWSYPLGLETPDLVFNLYHAFTLTAAPTHWPLLRVIPGWQRSATLNADHPQEFFALTASNQFGESTFAGGAQ